MLDPTYPLYPIFTFTGCVLVLIPLPWHLQAWNSGTCFYMIWAALACLNQFVNSVVWANNAINTAPIWCDISIRIMLGASVGLPAASLCINRRLYEISSVQSVAVSRAEKRRAVLDDTLICVLFPVVFIALQYVVQGHRFNIYENIGCYPVIYNTFLAYFLSGMWPIVIGIISGTYCVLSLRSFVRRRVELGQFLALNKSLTISRYFRLMVLATTEIMLTTPLAIFTIWLNATASKIDPWRGWADAHLDYSRVELFPAILWRNGSRSEIIGMELSRWLVPLCALIFFSFFGFADEAKRNYHAAFLAFMKRVGIQKKITTSGQKPLTIGSTPVKIALSSLPSYSPPSPTSTFTTNSPTSLKYPSIVSLHSDSIVHVNSPHSFAFQKHWTEVSFGPAPFYDHHDFRRDEETSVSAHSFKAGPFIV